MSIQTPVARDDLRDDMIDYPDRDGRPMSDNTLQFEWIVTLKEGIEVLCQDDPNVFVAGDLLWYPVEGRPDLRTAPDVLVAFGRPKGYRGSYRQWVEGGIAPQVVFEVLSPGNTESEMNRKLRFYDHYGVEEYYIYDPIRHRFRGWQRIHDRLEQLGDIRNWVSPRLGIRFELEGEVFTVIRPDGARFLTYTELDAARTQAEQARQAASAQADQERERAEQEHERAEQEHERAEQERERAERLVAQLRALGVEPEV